MPEVVRARPRRGGKAASGREAFDRSVPSACGTSRLRTERKRRLRRREPAEPERWEAEDEQAGIAGCRGCSGGADDDQSVSKETEVALQPPAKDGTPASDQTVPEEAPPPMVSQKDGTPLSWLVQAELAYPRRGGAASRC